MFTRATIRRTQPSSPSTASRFAVPVPSFTPQSGQPAPSMPTPRSVEEYSKVPPVWSPRMYNSTGLPAIQRKAARSSIRQESAVAQRPNNTGLPAHLKSSIELLSGMSLDNVKVHYNSTKPAQLNARAYAQGTDIYVARGQERHLPHEAWHVVQQGQGRVKPTIGMCGVQVNDDTCLEAEADRMAEKAIQFSAAPLQIDQPLDNSLTARPSLDKAISSAMTEASASSQNVAQLERYVNKKTSAIHLHLDIGKGDHLMIFADRYNLMGKSGYSKARVTAAREALEQAPDVPDRDACLEELALL